MGINEGGTAVSTVVKTETNSAAIIVQEGLFNGGTLRRGNPGNKGGGRPRDKVRAKLVDIYDEDVIPWMREVYAAPRELTIKCQCGQEHTVNPPADDKIKAGIATELGKTGVGSYKEVEDPRAVILLSAPPPLA